MWVHNTGCIIVSPTTNEMVKSIFIQKILIDDERLFVFQKALMRTFHISLLTTQ